jgi:hypothetical protein
MKHKIWPLISKAAWLFWALACLVIFMYYPGAISQIQDATLYEFSTLPEKLSRIPPARYFTDTLIAIAGMAFYAVSCTSLGMALSKIFRLDTTKNSDDLQWKYALIPTNLLIGNAVFSVVLLALAATSNLTRVNSILILSIGFLSGLGKFRKLPAPNFHITDRLGKYLFAFSLLIVAAAIFHSSARLSYDAASMYFSIAKLTAMENRADFYMENSFPVSALHSVIQYSSILQIFGDQAARLVTWLFGLTVLIIAMALAKLARMSPLAVRILPVLILTSTAFLDQMGDGKVDLISTAYSLAAIYWNTAASKDKEQNYRLYLLSGFFIGFASILRPYNSFLIGVFILAYIAQEASLNREFLIRTAKQLTWLAFGAVGFAVYHMLINTMLFDNPLAFLNSLTTVSPTTAPWDYKPESEWTNKLLYPLVVTFKNSGASLGNITPLVVAFIPAIAIWEISNGIRIQKELSRLIISACVALLSWILLIFSVVEVRYVMFLWIILFLFIAEVISGAIQTVNVMIKGLALCSMFVMLSFILIRSLYVSFSTYSPIDDLGNPICFDTDHCLIVKTINDSADQGDRVLTLSGMRYYLRNDLFACSTNHDEFRKFQKANSEDEEEFWREVYRQGYEYIAFEEGYVTDSAQINIIPGPGNVPQWITLDPIYGEPGDTKIAYQIHASDPPIDIEWVCRKNNETGNWQVQPAAPK